MKVNQATLYEADHFARDLATVADADAQLVLVFGSVGHFANPSLHAAVRAAFPNASVAGCTTAGEIGPDGVSDGSVVVSAIRFDKPGFKVASASVADMADSEAAGARIATALQGEGLHNVVLFGPGVAINGSALIAGFRSVLSIDVALSGGLAGDAAAFTGSWVMDSEGADPRRVVAIGFYETSTLLRHGTFHGWVPFGPERKVTRSDGSVLFELDGEPALDVYKRYLGDYAKDLPGSGLLFPFEMLGADRSGVGLIRTILGVDEAAGSLVLAGDIIPDGFLRLMHANTDSLVDGAETAAERVRDALPASGEALAILVSCVGRKLVMGQRVDEEVEAVAEVFGDQAKVAGFYSNGEISPVVDGLHCALHNQTMTITYLCEA